MEDHFIKLINVTKIYHQGDNPVVALDHINLNISKEEFLAITGKSGCGKSTLLKIMSGLLSPSEGSVILSGKPVTGPRRDIGMMFQQPTLFPWRTSIENVVLHSGKPEQARNCPRLESRRTIGFPHLGQTSLDI